MRRPAANPVTIGLISLVVAVLVVYFGFAKDIPFVNEPYTIKAAFRDSSGMRVDSPVRIAGVEVGRVTAVQHTSPGARAATATLAINDAARPIHADARAKIRPRIFLEGNFFVDLQPGTPQAGEMGEGEVIPTERTENPVQLDQVLQILRQDTRQDLKTALAELGNAQEAGAGEAFNESLRHQPAAYRYSAIVAEALLGRRPGDLGDWVRDQGVVAQALDANPERLRALITNFNTFAGALAASDDDLRESVDELPETLREALPAFDDVNAALPSVRRFSRAALPGVRSSGPTIDALLPLVRQLRGLVQEDELQGLAADLRAAVPSLAGLARSSLPVLEELRRSASCTAEVLVPFGNQKINDENFPAKGPVYQELAQSMSGLAGESRSFDANGQWQKVLGSGGLETVSLGNNRMGAMSLAPLGVNPPPQEDPPPLRPQVPCETQEPPILETRPDPPPPTTRANPDDPKVKARVRKSADVAAALMQRRAEAQGQELKFGDRMATREDLERVGRENGLLDQLQRLIRAANEGRTIEQVDGG